MQSEPILFKPLNEIVEPVWHKPASFAFATQVSQIPLADSELLLTSFYLPIAIDFLNEKPRVVAIIDSRFQRRPAIGQDGKWQKDYLPLALRCLPFRLAHSKVGDNALEIAVNLPQGNEPGISLHSSKNVISPEVRKISLLLQRLEEGKRHLQQAAEKLVIAGVLTPVQLNLTAQNASQNIRSFTVNRDVFATLSGTRIALLAKDNFLAIDLAAACIFSQRFMPTLVSVSAEDKNSNIHRTTLSSAIDDLINPIKLNTQIDDGELFSYENFQTTRHAS